MGSWNDILEDFEQVPDEHKTDWLGAQLTDALSEIGALRGGRHVLLYASAFLQKPGSGSALSVNHEDMNGFMSTIYQMDWDKGLTLILHTPGGDPNAAAAIVDYLRSKFEDVEVVVPGMAMSAGTMMALASDLIVMGRQSQLGPIDPQFVGGGRQMSARAVVEQFERARKEILDDQTTAHVWAPLLAQAGPSLLQEAQNALDYSENMVADWLTQWMKSGEADPVTAGRDIAHHFNDATTHKSHGRRINRSEAAANGVVIEELEANDDLQESVLTAYHLMTIMFEQTMLVKFICSDHGRAWYKNFDPS